MNKELVVEFIYSSSGVVSLKIKPSKEEFSVYEIYYIYKYIERILKESNFDWNSTLNIQSSVRKGEDM